IQSRRGLLPVAAYGPRCMRLLLPGAQNRIFIPNLAESKGRAVIGRGLDGLTLKSAVSGPKRWTTQVLTSILARAEPAPSSRSRGAVTAGGVPDPHRAANAVCGRGIFLPIETFSGAVSRTIPAQRGLAPTSRHTVSSNAHGSPHLIPNYPVGLYGTARRPDGKKRFADLRRMDRPQRFDRCFP